MIPLRLYAYAACALAIAGCLWWGYSTIWDRGYEKRDTEAKAEMQAYRNSVEAERLKWAEQARATEQQYREAFDAIASKREQERRDAEQAELDLVTDLRTDVVRLRRHWQGCVATAGLAQASAAAAEPDAAAQLRAEAAAAVVRVGADCDAQVRGLQQVIEAR